MNLNEYRFNCKFTLRSQQSLCLRTKLLLIFFGELKNNIYFQWTLNVYFLLILGGFLSMLYKYFNILRIIIFILLNSICYIHLRKNKSQKETNCWFLRLILIFICMTIKIISNHISFLRFKILWWTKIRSFLVTM